LRHVGRGYFVLRDSADQDCSPRAEGDVWIGVESDTQLTIVMLPDHTNKHGLVVLRPERDSTSFVMCLDEGEVVQRQWASCQVGGEYHITWDAGLGRMA
jgi:hypothetical protein